MPRRLRAALIIAALWGVPWAVCGAALQYNRVRHGGFEFDYIHTGADVARNVVAAGVFAGLIGAGTGLLFGVLLAANRGEIRQRPLTVPRMAASGARAGMLLPAALALGWFARDPRAVDWLDLLGLLGMLVLAAAAGAVCGAGTWLLATRASSVARPTERERAT